MLCPGLFREVGARREHMGQHLVHEGLTQKNSPTARLAGNGQVSTTPRSRKTGEKKGIRGSAASLVSGYIYIVLYTYTKLSDISG